MTQRLSTALRNALASNAGFSTAFDKGVIEIRTGPQPVSGDAAATGILLGTVTVSSGAFTPGSPTNGLSWDAPVNGVVSKAAAEVWSFNGLTAGVAGWFRLKGNAADAGAADNSATYMRLDGSIGTTGADMNLASISIASGAPNLIQSSSWDVLDHA